jgi:group II intron reverse transcriptase/maturase
MEPRLEVIFKPDSYGYRPGRNAHQALESCLQNCRQYSWVIDLDIKGYFDNIDHELLMRALKHHFKERWVLMYVERWLKAPIIQKGGEKEARHQGTPQGGVISPLLSNLFLHYALDRWLSVNYSQVRYERFADDMVVHCRRKVEAESMLSKLKERLASLKLQVNATKTKIVYCKNGIRKERYPEVSFTFLGHQFRPCKVKTRTGKYFLGYAPQIGMRAAKKIIAELRRMRIHKKTSTSLHQLAAELNPKLRGWISYYGKYGGSKFRYILHILNTRLHKWVRWRYKLKGRPGKIIEKLKKLCVQSPNLFAHWQLGVRPLRAQVDA